MFGPPLSRREIIATLHQRMDGFLATGLAPVAAVQATADYYKADPYKVAVLLGVDDDGQAHGALRAA